MIVGDLIILPAILACTRHKRPKKAESQAVDAGWRGMPAAAQVRLIFVWQPGLPLHPWRATPLPLGRHLGQLIEIFCPPHSWQHFGTHYGVNPFA